ncbi:hypothetical protein ARALYDRAFT_326521 [Arabidopsis lyrata subsp. lyrata]|uniref:Uncharacterized protein n=1 Tax=Arabidopsis lyrata subsp. lyrata TaxID=81972 RepID=D7M0T7_ARALL|nr:hypothetical protein ARALYDRAFT_326521 [Arabidopsis lyrata subsp. lyrata]
MANQNYQTHTFCLFATVVIQGLSPSIANQTPATPLEPFLIWIIYQFVWLSLKDLTDSYRIHWRPFFVMSIPWNCDVLLGRRFVSGAFAHYRWIFRLSTGESPLTEWYGDVTWVFDPGINEGIILLDGTGIIYQIGYGTWYSCVECDNGFLVPLKLSDDGDGFPLPWLEFFVSWIDCMGLGLYGSKVKVMTFFYDDDGDYFPWSEAFLLSERVHRYIQLTCLWYNPNQVTSVMRRKMVKSDCDGDVFSFPWSENHISMKWKIMGTNRQRCVRRFEYIVLSFKRQELESFQATLQFFLLIRVMRKAFWSFIYKMIANYEYVKGGRNRFYLLACKASDWKAGSFPLLHRNCVQFPLFVSMVVFEWFIYHVKLSLLYNII